VFLAPVFHGSGVITLLTFAWQLPQTIFWNSTSKTEVLIENKQIQIRNKPRMLLEFVISFRPESVLKDAQKRFECSQVY
jgi:hypothetical protein